MNEYLRFVKKLKPLLTTPRLDLILFNQETYNEIFSVCSKQEIMRLFGHKNEQEYQIELDRFQGGFSTYNLTIQFFQLIEKQSQKVIGWAGYHSWAKMHFRAELFYALKDDDFKHKGFISEALPSILDYGKIQMQLRRIEAFVAIDNTASNRIMQKFGFKKEATIKHRYQFGDDVDTDYLYSLFPNPNYQ